MIIKKRTKPRVLQTLEAVIPRLSPQFPRLAELQGELSRRYKGYIGEQKVDYHLDQFARKYTILQGICLELQRKNFEIDTIVITQQAIYCIECKNFNGTIIFDTVFNQFIRNDGKVETGFRHPITQAENHQLQLTQWLHERHHYIPVYFFIAISDRSTVIKVNGDEEAIAKVVAHGAFIPQKIIEKEKALKAGGQSRAGMQPVGAAILRECKEYDFDILRKYGVSRKDIMTGVHCPGCGRLGMERIYGAWRCHDCNQQSKHAHKRSLSDYLQLINPWISNKECMRFLQLKSRAVATRLLRSSNLKYQKEHKRWIK